MEKRHLKVVAGFVLAAALNACGGGATSSLPGTLRVATVGSTATFNSGRHTAFSALVTPSTYIAIDAGGGPTGSWVADTDFNVGLIGSTINPIATGLVLDPAPQAVYQTQRYAPNLVYTIPNLTPSGAYNVRLHFVESYFHASGDRLFGVKINGTEVLSSFDVFAAAGGANIAIVKTFASSADASGKITIALSATVNNASIAGIEVIGSASTPAPSPTPVTVLTAINAGGNAVGNWLADVDFTGGWVASPVNVPIGTGSVSNPAPQSVYQTQRAGTAFSCSISNLGVNAAYTIRLHFVESFFYSAGQRLFNVTINGVKVLSNFDIYQAAGGRNSVIVESFGGNADNSGKISIAFTATVNNASIAGIEILAGGGAVSPTPTPSPTVAGSPSPTPTPSNGVQWPAPGWVPYPVSPLTVPVAPNPTFTAGSADIINALWSGNPADAGRFEVSAGPPPPDTRDYSQPLYFGSASDPQYTVSCFDFGGNCPAANVVVHIPIGAYPAGGTDHHIAIRDLVSGKDVMLWLAPVPNGVGGPYPVGWGTVISSSGDGRNAVGGSASGLSALWALRETDLEHNTINHAIIVEINGESANGYVYPAVGWDNGYFHANPWPQMGAHFWLDVGPPYASGCPQYAISYLTALHKYGAYFADQGGISTPMEANYESDMDYTYNGGASVWGPLMQSLGGQFIGHSVLQMTNCGVNLQTHMHILTPPSPA